MMEKVWHRHTDTKGQDIIVKKKSNILKICSAIEAGERIYNRNAQE